jgi:hypothetical protein
MAENTLTVDLDRLRALADRLERTSNDLNGFRPPGADAADLTDSDTNRAAAPERLAELFDPILHALSQLALDARAAADAFEHMESDNAGRIAGR